MDKSTFVVVQVFSEEVQEYHQRKKNPKINRSKGIRTVSHYTCHPFCSAAQLNAKREPLTSNNVHGEQWVHSEGVPNSPSVQSLPSLLVFHLTQITEVTGWIQCLGEYGNKYEKLQTLLTTMQTPSGSWPTSHLRFPHNCPLNTTTILQTPTVFPHASSQAHHHKEQTQASWAHNTTSLTLQDWGKAYTLQHFMTQCWRKQTGDLQWLTWLCRVERRHKILRSFQREIRFVHRSI